MIFDSHAHYDDDVFDEDREELLFQMRRNHIETIINVAASVDGITRTVELAGKYPFIYAAIGVHPDEVGQMDDEVISHMHELCKQDKIIAVGEIGLDYYWDKENHKNQLFWFERQMEVARAEKLPFIIHSREAAADTLEAAKRLRAGEIGGVIHCFSYGKEIAREYLNMGLYLGIGGVVTFANARKLKEVVEYVPLESLLLETDCPYLAPVPFRGKRNSSLNIPYVIEEIARIKHISPEVVEAVTYENARKLFGI